MISLTDIATATGGDWHGDPPNDSLITGIADHSGRVRPGQLFVAIRGEVHDAHRFIPQALSNGATALLVADDWATAQPPLPVPVLRVPDTVVALQQCARYWRNRRPDLIVVGVTGSVGKTSTKEAVAGVLGRCYRTHKNIGNLNTEIGLPLTLLALQPSDQAMVLEIGGAYAMGEVALLAGIAQPQIGIVTNVGPTHLQRMGTIEAIAMTKRELVTALPPDGLAILNGDDPRVRAMGEGVACRRVLYGTSPGCDLLAQQVESYGFDGLRCLVSEGHSTPRPLRIPLAGRHSLYTALAALAVGRQAGIPWEEIEAGLAGATAPHRLQRIAGPNGALLIDDTYNSSPASARSALLLLGEAPAQRRIAVLGGMAELGTAESDGHAEIGTLAAEVADLVVTYGTLAQLIASAARSAGGHVIETMTRDEAIERLRSELQAGDVALLKGSRGLAMDEIVAALAIRQDLQVADREHQ